MRELRAPVTGRHWLVHATIRILAAAVASCFILPPVVGVLIVPLGGAD